MYDVVLSWRASPSSSVTAYQVSWTWGTTTKTVVHPATDVSASFVTDTGVTLVHGNVIAASIVAVDDLGQTSARVSATPGTVAVPTPPPPSPPSNVTLTLSGTP